MGNDGIEGNKRGGGYRIQYACVSVVLLVVFAVILAGAAAMAYMISRSPELISMAYDKITLPQSLQFMTGLKGVFRIFIMLICCVPVSVVYYVMLLALSKYSTHYNE